MRRKKRERLAALETWRIAHGREHELERDVECIRYENVDRRLNDINELHRKIEDERGSFVEKEWFERMHALLTNRVTMLEATSSERTGASRPEHDWVKWLGAVAIATLTWLATKMSGK